MRQMRIGMTLLGALALCATTVATGCKSDGDAAAQDMQAGAVERFSFFVTSLRAMQKYSNSQLGFGGDLRFGETGPGAGLRGADKICATIAEASMPGAGQKVWRAFLSAVSGEDGKQVDAIDRVGNGPWYDRLGRTFALTRADLLNERPANADPTIQNDFPNEDGVPNHAPDVGQGQVDNHDFLTGTGADGRLYGKSATCLDWTGGTGDKVLEGKPRVGHSWPRGGFGGPGGRPDGGGPGRPDGFGPGRPDGGGPGRPDGFNPGMPDGFNPGMPDGGGPGRPDGGGPGRPDGFGGPGDPGGIGSINNWMSSLDESGCAPGVNIVEMGPPMSNSNTVGSGGGYGGIYCFALTP